MSMNNNIVPTYCNPPLAIPILPSTSLHLSTIEPIYSYEQIETDRHILKRLLHMLGGIGEATQESHPKADKLNVAETFMQIPTSFTAVETNPYENEAKTLWAKTLLTKVQVVIAAMVTKAASNPDFLAIQEKVAGMQKQDSLSDEDFQYIYNLPTTLFDAIESSALTGGEKAELITLFATAYTDDGLTNDLAKIRIEGLQDILQVIKTTIPSTFTPFKELETILSALSQQTAFSEEDLLTIATASQTLATLITDSDLERAMKISLDARIVTIYKDQVNIANMYETAFEAVSYSSNFQSETFTAVTNMVTSLMGIFSSIDLSTITMDITSAEICGALQLVRAINARFFDLNSELRTAINNVLQTLIECNIGNYIGSVWAYFVASTVLSINSNASMQDISAAISDKAKEMEDNAFVLAGPIHSAMLLVPSSGGGGAGHTSFPSKVISQQEDYTIYSESGGKVSINAILLNYVDPASATASLAGLLYYVTKSCEARIPTTAAAYSTFKTSATQIIAQLKIAAKESETKKNNFSTLKEGFYAEQVAAHINQLGVTPLPSAIASVLINHFMPNEVDFLTKIQGQLYFSNLGSDVGNAVIDAISNYINAGSYFNFASYIGRPPTAGSRAENTFNGDAKSARERLELEISKAAEYIAETQNAQIVIQQQKAIVEADKVITSEQRDEILNALSTYDDNLSSISGSLVLLQNYLNAITITDGSESGTFVVQGGKDQWQTRLEILEQSIVSGLPGNSVAVGAFALQSMVQSNQQSFADLGQNHQLELQMHLTSMQQEWTVVATSLQVLNQVYLGLARSISA